MNRRLKSYFVAGIFIVIFAIFIQHIIQEKSLKKKANNTQILSIGFEAKVQVFDPRLIGFDANSQYIEELLFLKLISSDLSGNLQNRLVDKIIPTSNKSWKLKLKKGILFASGQEITADDVIATYQSILSPPFGFPASPRQGAFKNVKKFEKISSDEISIELKEPDSAFLPNLVIGILPKEAALNAPPGQITGKGYESGPFLLKSASDTDVILVKNTKFNLTHLAKMNEIDFKIIPDTGTRFAALIKGDIDLIQNSLDPDKVDTIERRMGEQFNIYRKPRLATYYLGINFKDPHLKILKVRQAIAHALDVNTILKYRLHSKETIASSMFPEENLYFNPKIHPMEFNPELSKSLLKESGLSLPIKITIKVATSNKSAIEIVKSFAANLKTVGFDPIVDQLDISIFFDQVRKGISQLWYGQWIGFKDPDHLRFVFASNMTPPNGGNRGFYFNPKLDILLQQGKENFIFENRKKIYDESQELLAADVPYIYLWHGENLAVTSKNVLGFSLESDGKYWSLINVSKQ